MVFCLHSALATALSSLPVRLTKSWNLGAWTLMIVVV
jgi:hypothetical protein